LAGIIELINHSIDIDYEYMYTFYRKCLLNTNYKIFRSGEL
jgi:hypothetical protein